MNTSSLDIISKFIRDGLGNISNITAKSSLSSDGKFDINDYFESNICKEPLADDDMITISKKTNDGYKAVFVKLGELRNFLNK